MIFRRSLVRELTATAVGLFLVLLAILFTNLVLRLRARASRMRSLRRTLAGWLPAGRLRPGGVH